MSKLLENGGLTPLIDKIFTLGQVPEAMRYYVEGKTRV